MEASCTATAALFWLSGRWEAFGPLVEVAMNIVFLLLM